MIKLIETSGSWGGGNAITRNDFKDHKSESAHQGGAHTEVSEHLIQRRSETQQIPGGFSVAEPRVRRQWNGALK